jgi:hypothetical protein
MMACTCHPSDSGKLEIGGLWSRPAWPKKKDHSSNLTRARKGWSHVLSERAPALQAWSPEFKLLVLSKKKKKKDSVNITREASRPEGF